MKKFWFLAAQRPLRFFEQLSLWWTLFLVSEVVYFLIFSRKKIFKKSHRTLKRKLWLTKDEILENFSLNYENALHF